MSDIDEPTSKLSRRDFIKLGLLTVAGAALAGVGKVEPIRSIIYGPRVDDVPREIPPVLLDKNIPMSNENLRSPLDIVTEGINLYENWRNSDGNLKPPKYNPPSNHLELGDLADDFKKYLEIGPEHYKEYEGVAWKLEEIIDKNDIPHGSFLAFGGRDIHFVRDLVLIDPGSGIAQIIKDRLTEEFGKDYDPYSEIKKGNFNEKAQEIARETFADSFVEAESYIRHTANGKKISSSVLFAYFLYKNDGDLGKSLYDTTIFFKVAARNNPQTLEYEPKRDGAEFINDLFIDEFSTEIPLDWLLENVPEEDPILNNLPEAKDRSEYKDFMPINRAGQFYHAWNIIAWNSSMDPILNESLSISYYIHGKLGGIDMRPLNGRVKVASDMRVAGYSKRIKSVLKKYL